MRLKTERLLFFILLFLTKKIVVAKNTSYERYKRYIRNPHQEASKLTP